MNGIEDDVRSVSSDNDNERVREKLKKTTIAPSSRPGSGAKTASEQQDEVMASTPSPTTTTTTRAAAGTVLAEDRQRATRKRSHDESDEDPDEVGNGRRRLKAHERKRSRDISEEDMMRAGSGLERVKTPPTHPEETGGISERVSSPRGGLERKRSLGKLDKEGENEDQKSKISKTEEERRKKEESEVADDKMPETGKKEGEKAEIKLPENSGFANASTKSPFAAAAGSGINLFGSNTNSSNLFANSKFGALSGSAASPFGALGAKSGSQSPFGAFGVKASTSGFGSGSAFGPSSGGSAFGGSVFGSGSAVKSQPAKKPFGAPDEDDKSDDEEDGSSDDGEDKKEKEAKEEDGGVKLLALKEQEVMTGEEDETTIFKCNAKAYFFDADTKVWKERGRGALKVNRTTPSVSDFGLASDDEGDAKEAVKKSARLIMRTDGTFVVILNTPIYKDMKIGDEPTTNVVNVLAQESGKLVNISIKVRNAAMAKELYKHIANLKKEISG
ncbi:hypothetical protein BDD12DRAFT_520335 [Trichophaea hybrida]|nr:hypothetical protein BDD12DRAFT_520335 [Trichophaea hybrida]